MLLDRVGIIGDIHVEDRLLERAINFLSQSNLKSLSVGDIADYGDGSFDRCCSLLRDFDIDTVRGNHDRWLLENTMRTVRGASFLTDLSNENREWFRALPVVREYPTSLGPMLLCHGLGTKDMAKINPDDFGYSLECNEEFQALKSEGRVRFVINGHSHRAMVRTFGSLTIINAGALRSRDEAFVVIADFQHSVVEWHRLPASGEPKLDSTFKIAR